MSVRPIDLQTNLTQSLKVGDNEHSRSVAMAEQQHMLSKEADQKSKLVNERLDEVKKGDSNIIRDKKEREQTPGRGLKHDEQHQPEKKARPGEPVEDEHVGRIIDVLK